MKIFLLGIMSVPLGALAILALWWILKLADWTLSKTFNFVSHTLETALSFIVGKDQPKEIRKYSHRAQIAAHVATTPRLVALQIFGWNILIGREHPYDGSTANLTPILAETLTEFEQEATR